MFIYLLSADDCLSSLQRKLNSSSHACNFAFMSTFAATVQRKTPPTPTPPFTHVTRHALVGHLSQKSGGEAGVAEEDGLGPQAARQAGEGGELAVVAPVHPQYVLQHREQEGVRASVVCSESGILCFSRNRAACVCNTAHSMQPQHTYIHTAHTHAHARTHTHAYTHIIYTPTQTN